MAQTASQAAVYAKGLIISPWQQKQSAVFVTTYQCEQCAIRNSSHVLLRYANVLCWGHCSLNCLGLLQIRRHIS
jgi:hypothetical protein